MQVRGGPHPRGHPRRPGNGVVADPRSVRSQFSQSCSREIAAASLPGNLAAAAGLNASFEPGLNAAFSTADMSIQFVVGRRIPRAGLRARRAKAPRRDRCRVRSDDLVSGCGRSQQAVYRRDFLQIRHKETRRSTRNRLARTGSAPQASGTRPGRIHPRRPRPPTPNANQASEWHRRACASWFGGRVPGTPPDGRHGSTHPAVGTQPRGNWGIGGIQSFSGGRIRPVRER